MRRLLAAVVLGSFVVKTAAAWLQATPVYLPDEYMYSALSRSLATSGRASVQGGSAHFSALLVPLLEAPAWLAGSVAVGYRIVQAEQALVISLSALPVYWLARRLRIERNRALVIAAIALLVPDTVYSSALLSESFALPLFLGSVCAAVAALDRGGPRRWALFGSLALLTTATRMQFAFLLPLVPIVAVAIEARRRRWTAALRPAAVLLAALVFAGAVVAVAGASVLAGRYDALLRLSIGPGDVLRWMSYNGLLLAFASGWVIVPAALVGLWRLLARPDDRAEDAFSLLTMLVLGALLVQAALFAGGGLSTMERYTFYAAPLLLVAFGVAWQRGLLRLRSHAVLALGLTGAGLLLPHFTQLLYTGTSGAPSLLAYRALQRLAGWQAALGVGVVAGALATWALALGRRGNGHVLAGLAALVAALLLGGSQLEFYDTAAAAAAASGPSLSFADDAGVHNAAMLMFTDTAAPDVERVAFWNRSITGVVRLGKGTSSDGFHSLQAEPGRTGELLVGDRPLDRPLVVDRTAAYASFDRPPIVRTPVAELLPAGTRLQKLVDGYVTRGSWLATSGTFQAWPGAAGTGTQGELELRLWGRRRSLELLGPDCKGRIAVTRAPRDVRIDFDAPGVWSCHFAVSGSGLLVGNHIVAVHAAILRFTQQ